MQPAAVPPETAVSRSALRDRLLDLRTLISFAILAVVLFVVLTHVQLDYGASLRAIRQTNLAIYVLAIAAFYFSFVIRTVRWQLLLRNTGESEKFGELFHIIILAWFANCVLPAKMGDFYRAYLLRQQTDVSGSKGLGTVFSERALDFLVLMSLLVISGLISFHATVPQKFVPAFIVGLLICAGLIAGLLVIRYSEGRFSRFLPERLRERAARFKHGLLSAFAGRLPLLLGLTVVVWMAESARLFLVVQALPLHLSLGVAQVVFIALVASLLTTIPALPGGLVLVEGGIIAVLVVFGLTPSQGFTVAILDRLISYWSLIGVGLVVFLLSHRR
ncbi:MAG TPA: lysylphosphatidylglycerol synthase transmembrane domain-containing protein [Candidatus Dormibacteraeota bacterium]|nr:lysylphosphatidylglycerol synthase transmembrane domain-containing protein [Candidatus Dormibacteraeota bacterium]